jgi:hypothetical protein
MALDERHDRRRREDQKDQEAACDPEQTADFPPRICHL